MLLKESRLCLAAVAVKENHMCKSQTHSFLFCRPLKVMTPLC